MNMPQNIKHFVTGGAGFIGSHVVDKLIAEGNQVTVFDNLVSGKKEWLEPHSGKSNFQFIEADLLDYDTLFRAMKGHEIIWHLGANTDIPRGNRITDLDLKSCTIATRNVLEVMMRSNIDKILFASSAAVYGNAPPQSLKETFGPLLPISLYGAGKLACEGLISAYCHLFNIKAWIFRFANVIGGRMSHGVIYDFIHKLRKNSKEMEILGDGKQEKTYYLVEDCIDGMLCAFRNSNEQYDVYNLGSESPILVSEIARIVVEEMGIKKVKFTYTGGSRGWPGDVSVVWFNVDKMTKLGWKVSCSSEETVRLTVRRLLDNE